MAKDAGSMCLRLYLHALLPPRYQPFPAKPSPSRVSDGGVGGETGDTGSLTTRFHKPFLPFFLPANIPILSAPRLRLQLDNVGRRRHIFPRRDDDVGCAAAPATRPRPAATPGPQPTRARLASHFTE